MVKIPDGGTARRNLRERRVLRVLYAGTVLVLLLLLFASVRTFDSYSRANRTILECNAVLHELESLTSGLKDAEVGLGSYTLTHDTAFMRPFHRAQPVVERSIRRLDSLQRAGATGLDLGPIQGMSRQMLKLVQDRFLAERSSDTGLQGHESELLGRTRDLEARVRLEKDRLAAETGRIRDASLNRERSLKPDTPIMMLVFSVLAVVVSGLLFWRLFRALAKAEQAEMETLRKMDELAQEVRTREFAERLLKRVLDSSASAILAFRSVRDGKGRVVDQECILANRESGNLLGPGLPDELVGRHLLEHFPELRAPDLYQALLEVVETGTPYAANRQSVVRPGSWLNVHALRLLDGFVITLTDISETRRVQELLAESDRLAITGGIARTIAHEVRNPLTNLQMALEQMLDELEPKVREELSPYSDILARNTGRIRNLITDLLESSKPRDLDKRPCRVRDLLEQAVSSVQDRMDLLRMKASVEVGEGVDSVSADPAMLGVALTNLCINAIEAMQEGQGQLRLQAKLHQGKVRILVTDNGKGIPAGEIQRLFQAFYSGRPGGMGLGLTSARTILNAHGVHVDVESQVGRGTDFILTFPVS